ncbi:MAG: shikimate kinase [Lachnospiraceae bacterium]|nr:shikimate kinase [Lachnospiraceae bacterium]
MYMRNIILIGFMGAGKTAVGNRLSKKLGYEYIDTDQYIEEKEGMTISNIFAEKGEDYFRNLETSVIKELMLREKATIFSTGGGMPLRRENAELLKELGVVVYLKATPDTIYGRVKGDTKRPLLQCDNPKQKIMDLLEIRNPKYEAACDYAVCVDNKDIQTVAQEVTKLL